MTFLTTTAVKRLVVDLLKSIANISSNLKEGGYACFVVGNRNSGGQVMRLDLFTLWALQNNGFEKVEEIIERKLVNTKMPQKISPSGRMGDSRSTMNFEYIIICKKK